MPVDASIYGQIQQPQQINPLNALAQSLQIKGLQSQLDRGDRETAQQNKLAELYKSSVGQDGAINRQQLLTGAASSGLGMQIPALQKGFSEQDKASREAQKAELEGVIQKFDVGSRIMSAYDPANPQSWNAVRQQTAQLLGADAAARLPEQPPTPEQIQQNMNRAMSAKELAEQKYKMLTFGETQRHNNATEGLTAQGQAVTMRNADLSSDTARRGQDLRATAAAATQAQKTAPKPLPAAALKMQQEGLDAIGTASSINSDLDAVNQQITDGKLKFGPVGNLANKALNASGMSTEESRNFASFQANMEKLRNDSLRLNKGVQTDGDAQRAWNELFSNINDTKVVQQRLGEIKRLNERAVELRKLDIDNVRSNYGQDPMDTEKYSKVPTALNGGNKGGAPDLSSLEAELKRRGLLK